MLGDFYWAAGFCWLTFRVARSCFNKVSFSSNWNEQPIFNNRLAKSRSISIRGNTRKAPALLASSRSRETCCVENIVQGERYRFEQRMRSFYMWILFQPFLTFGMQTGAKLRFVHGVNPPRTKPQQNHILYPLVRLLVYADKLAGNHHITRYKYEPFTFRLLDSRVKQVKPVSFSASPFVEPLSSTITSYFSKSANCKFRLNKVYRS